MDFKTKLLELLDEHGLTQADFSEKAKIPKTTINGWLKANRLPGYYALKNMSLFFDVTADFLLGLKDENDNKLTDEKLLK